MTEKSDGVAVVLLVGLLELQQAKRLVSDAILNAAWKSSEVVLVRSGVRRIFRLDSQPMNASALAYHSASAGAVSDAATGAVPTGAKSTRKVLICRN
jgi:hypothetical protein